VYRLVTGWRILLLPVSNLTDLQSDYSSLIRYPTLKHLLQVEIAKLRASCMRYKTNGECYQLVPFISRRLRSRISFKGLESGTYILHLDTNTTRAESSSLDKVDFIVYFSHYFVCYAYILFTTTKLMRILFESFLAFNN